MTHLSIRGAISNATRGGRPIYHVILQGGGLPRPRCTDILCRGDNTPPQLLRVPWVGPFTVVDSAQHGMSGSSVYLRSLPPTPRRRTSIQSWLLCPLHSSYRGSSLPSDWPPVNRALEFLALTLYQSSEMALEVLSDQSGESAVPRDSPSLRLTPPPPFLSQGGGWDNKIFAMQSQSAFSNWPLPPGLPIEVEACPKVPKTVFSRMSVAGACITYP